MRLQGSVDAVLTQQELRCQFVIAELELAATFSNIALNTTMDDRFRRNSTLAYQAYDTAIQFLAVCTLTCQQKQIISNRLREARSKLKELDRRSDYRGANRGAGQV